MRESYVGTDAVRRSSHSELAASRPVSGDDSSWHQAGDVASRTASAESDLASNASEWICSNISVRTVPATAVKVRATQSDREENKDVPVSPGGDQTSSGASSRKDSGSSKQSFAHSLPARVAFEFTALKENQLSVAEGELVYVLDNRKNWWTVQNMSGIMGKVLNNYLQVLGAPPSS
jgi:hypothetical protein